MSDTRPSGPSVTRQRPGTICRSRTATCFQDANISRRGLSLFPPSFTVSSFPALAAELLLYKALLMYNGLLRARQRHR